MRAYQIANVFVGDCQITDVFFERLPENQRFVRLPDNQRFCGKLSDNQRFCERLPDNQRFVRNYQKTNVLMGD